MKGKLIALVGILCIACLIVSGANAKGKPIKPEEKTNAELIIFTGDLSGSQVVEDCCPNAGPFPEYTMWLNFAVPGFPADYDNPIYGQLFINGYRLGHDRKYIVQFWNDHDGPDHIAIEIIGGEIYEDKKAKTFMVDFKNVDCLDQHTGEFIAEVSFTLERIPY